MEGHPILYLLIFPSSSRLVYFFIVGYDKNKKIGELYRREIPGNVTLKRRINDAGAVWNGESVFIISLILGYDPQFLSNSHNYKLIRGKAKNFQKYLKDYNFTYISNGVVIFLTGSRHRWRKNCCGCYYSPIPENRVKSRNNL